MNPEAQYVVYMKLAEIHSNYMPDTQMCQVYRDRAQDLKRVLAGEESAAAGDGNVEDADTESGTNKEKDLNDDRGHTDNKNIIFDIVSEHKKHKNGLDPKIAIRQGSDLKCTDTNTVDVTVKDDHSLCDAEGVYGDTSERDTVASHSYSDSIYTESFDTAKEQISDSSSSTDTLQTYQKPTDEKGSEFDTDISLPGQIRLNHPSDIRGQADTRNTDSDAQDEQNNGSKDTKVKADDDLDNIFI